MKAFYNKLISDLTGAGAVELFTAKNLPAVRHIDLYRGQYLFEAEFEQLILPAVLLEYSISHESRSANIILHCCWEQIFETESKSQDKDNALLYLDWLDALYDILYNLESEHTGKLTLLSEGMREDDTPTHVHIFNFECSYMGRVKTAAGKYDYAQGEDVSTTGTINAPTQEPRVYDL